MTKIRVNAFLEAKSQVNNYKYSLLNPLRITFASLNKAKNKSKRII